MEKDLANLSLDDEEKEILQAHRQIGSVVEDTKFCLVGCFLTASVIHFLTMRNTMTNLWHLVKGVQISNLGEKRFLFKFFHKIDMERVVNETPWTFNNHFLMIHCLEKGEDSLKAPLIFSYFWIQIHDVPQGFRSEAMARQLGDFLGKFVKYDNASLGKGFWNFLRVRVCLDVCRPLKRKKKVMFSPKNYGYVTFKYERLTLFYFFCGCLGHDDSFCSARMPLRVEVAKMGWDLSLRAQSKRALTMNIIWLKEKEVGEKG
ncbi:hypothetical protein Gohar_013322 [Gossypium harknessii]|uniref:DUF4283 domain-containing protein n=1 Tax=Gossypium harknessii TaxID=34285 RepID=A0A7J9GZR5_9ROSI|nr:hypothetical protein [Gossypium harknessii]